MATKETNPKDAVGVRKAPVSCLPANVLMHWQEATWRRGLGDLDPRVVLEVGLGMFEGARKYGRHNYRRVGVRASVYVDAAYRHLAAFRLGRDTDPDSGLPEPVKALASVSVLYDAVLSHTLVDDRPPRPREGSIPERGRYTTMEPNTAGSQYASALDRLLRWWEGDNFESGSTVHNLAEVMADLYLLRLWQIGAQTGFETCADWDDRKLDVNPPAADDWLEQLNAKTASIIDTYPDAKPAVTQENFRDWPQLAADQEAGAQLESDAGLMNDAIRRAAGEKGMTVAEAFGNALIERTAVDPNRGKDEPVVGTTVTAVIVYDYAGGARAVKVRLTPEQRDALGTIMDLSNAKLFIFEEPDSSGYKLVVWGIEIEGLSGRREFVCYAGTIAELFVKAERCLRKISTGEPRRYVYVRRGGGFVFARYDQKSDEWKIDPAAASETTSSSRGA